MVRGFKGNVIALPIFPPLAQTSGLMSMSVKGSTEPLGFLVHVHRGLDFGQCIHPEEGAGISGMTRKVCENSIESQ